MPTPFEKGRSGRGEEILRSFGAPDPQVPPPADALRAFLPSEPSPNIRAFPDGRLYLRTASGQLRRIESTERGEPRLLQRKRRR